MRTRLTPNALALAACILLYGWLVYYAAQRELWFDELFTYYIAKAPSVAKMFDEIRLDMNPPLMYLGARASMSFFGDSGLAARLPAIIGFLTGSLCLYRFVGRRLSPVYGLLALMVFWSTPFFRYSTEARPYGLLLGFFGLAMLTYQRASMPERPRWCVALLAVAVIGMMMSHFFALFYMTPFGFAEIIRTARSRKPDLPVWIALGIPCAFPFIYLQTMMRYQQIFFPPEFQASLRQMLRYYSFSLKIESPALLAAGGLGLVAAARLKALRGRWPLVANSIDAAFAVGLLMVPCIIVAALMRSHGAFYPRYAMPTALAYGLVFSAVLARLADRQRITAAVATVVLALYVGAYNFSETHKVLQSERQQVFQSGLRSTPLSDLRPDLPLVAASGLTFLQMDHYSDNATDARLFYLTDRERALRYAHATIFEGMPEVKKYFQIRANVEPYGRFVAAHPHFLVLGTVDYPEDWLLRCLLDSHAELRLAGNFFGPYKDSQVFEVTMPGG